MSIPQDKEAAKASQELTKANQNIHIEAEGVNVRYEYTADGANLFISPYTAPENSKEVEAIPTAYSTTTTPQEAEKSPNSCVDYVSMILLAILVLGELKDGFRLKKGV